jgi:hypothetical protein
MAGTGGSGHPGGNVGPDELVRWECRRHQTPILLGMYGADGEIHVKVRDRHWRILGTVQTRCPRCGAEHVLDLQGGRRAAPARAGGGRAQEEPG